MRDIIDSLPKYKPEVLVEVDSDGAWDAEDNVALYCAWATTIGTDKGLHSIQLGNPEGNLLFKPKPWQHPLPVFGFQWDHGHRGDAKPLGRTIAPMHYWINEMVRKMHDALHGIVPVVVGSKDPEWSDVPYNFIKQLPGDPAVQVIVPKSVSPDVRQADHRPARAGLPGDGAVRRRRRRRRPAHVQVGRGAVHLAQDHQRGARPAAPDATRGLTSRSARIIVSMAPDVYKTKQARGSPPGGPRSSSRSTFPR